jgi:hypothetical protein
MQPIFKVGDKVYLTEEIDTNDYEIVEIIPVDNDPIKAPTEYFKYKLNVVNGRPQEVVYGESEIFPITA